jgi:predicted transcriptional regulator
MHEEIKKLDLKFEPSIKILRRILKVILEKSYIGKTSLSVESNINYVKLLKYLEWMEGKQLVKFMDHNDKSCVTLSQKGREFSSILSSL